MIVITKMTMEDFEKIKDNLISDYDDFWTQDCLRSIIQNETFNIYVAKNETNEILGFGSIWKAIDDIHITNIVVVKNFRRRGIGEELLERLIEVGNKMGHKVITLEVKETNISAIKLYEKRGFEKVGVRKNYYDGNEDALIMTLNI